MTSEDDLGFIILPKDTSLCRPEEPDIKTPTFWSVGDPLCLLQFMISCSLHQILTFPFKCCIISNFLLSSFGVGSVSCSQLKGVTSGVFCCYSPSAPRFNVLCVHRCSSTSSTFFKILMLVWTSSGLWPCLHVFGCCHCDLFTRYLH